MAARRYPATGGAVSDRHAMLSAYGYSYPSTSPSAPQPRTSSPFENPYTSTAGGSSSSASTSQLRNGTSSSQQQSLDPYSEYDRKKHDDKPSPPSSSSWWPSSNNKQSDLQASLLEEQNDERLKGLSDKVAVLKSITVGIGNEVIDGTKDLNSLGEAMSNARDFLGGTMKRMNHMARRQGGWFCNMMLFLLFVCWLFVFLWWWRR
ncbi:unnamed protein product [Sympodiomycopsis kandeliae]